MLAGLCGETFHDGIAEFLLKRIQRRADEAVQALWRWWFNVQRPAAVGDLGGDMVALLVLGQDMLHQPIANCVSVLDGCFTKTKELAYLRAVVFDSATLPCEIVPGSLRNPGLPCEIFDDGWGYFLALPGEAAFLLKKLEQDGKAQATRSLLAAEQFLLFRS